MPVLTSVGEMLTLSEWGVRFRSSGFEDLPTPSLPVLVVDIPRGDSFEEQTSVPGQNSSAYPGDFDNSVVILVSRRVVSSAREFTIGRAAICDTVVPFGPVSKVHASLKEDSEGWKICDVGSTNGTRVEGRVLTKNTWHRLTDGALINFGAVNIRFWLPTTFINTVLAT